MVDIGVGLPSTIPGTPGETVIRWAQLADEGPFSSLSIIDRVVYPNQEPMAALAAAAAVTRRVRLMPSVLLATLREPVMLAKQAATVDVLSGGRLTLALGIGARPDDYQATGQPFRNRGRRLERTIETMRRIWRGEPLSDEVGPIGPRPVQPGGPPILIGANAEAAMARAARIADGFIGTPAVLGRAQEVAQFIRNAWREAGRSGTPSLKAAAYFALGDVEKGAAYLRDYYAFAGQGAEYVVQGMVTTPEAVRQVIKVCEEAGFDEVCLWPTVADLDQLRRLAEIVA
jgi:alkanesulfonate monooxygenase SsuD/methylene tetrahydromethanopterin reductase-like flavin-dependent oxidoreductase (luciferase family)